MKLLRGLGSGPAVMLTGSSARAGDEQRQRSIRGAAQPAPGTQTIDARLRELLLGAGAAHFRRDLQVTRR